MWWPTKAILTVFVATVPKKANSVRALELRYFLPKSVIIIQSSVNKSFRILLSILIPFSRTIKYPVFIDINYYLTWKAKKNIRTHLNTYTKKLDWNLEKSSNLILMHQCFHIRISWKTWKVESKYECSFRLLFIECFC